MWLMMSRRRLLFGLSALSASVGMAAPGVTATRSEPSGLNLLFKPTGRVFGTAVRFDQLEDMPALRSAVIENCGALTPEIDLTWASLEWERGRYNFGPVDNLLDFAAQHAMQVRGHTVLWGNSVPPWARRHMAETPGDWSVVARYMEAVLGRYRGRIADWILVNEAIDADQSDGLRRNAFYQSFGPGYVERAVREARRTAPEATLMLNEFSLEYDNPVDEARRKAVLQLLTRLKRADAPFDGLGLQAHLDLTKGHVQRRIILPFLREVAQLGLALHVTELDIQEADMSQQQSIRDRRVSDEVRRYLEIVLEAPNVKGVTSWGLSDPLSWLNSPEYKRRDIRGAQNGENRGLPLDDQMRKKPLYAAMSEVFAEASIV
jgi:endo-1,4-beta-xylanase